MHVTVILARGMIMGLKSAGASVRSDALEVGDDGGGGRLGPGGMSQTVHRLGGGLPKTYSDPL